ncbi:hypothetical protein [Streptomyces sp. SID3343]|uniref:hypothetical protein n=1 Tax=Streptomyces sp. SID3343 TaxID=2690260 RepID=UPI00136C7082|nr:hypothetical protein [Streptomyces sp. SID3343]MYW06715.1 hypothetical protein [Streptomyces sp. SID3343]
MRRLLPALSGAMILAAGAGSVPVAAASPRAAGVSSLSQTTNDAQRCDTYEAYGIRLCLALVSSTFTGQATVHAPPSNCAGYRVHLYDWATARPVASTSRRPCGETPSKQVTADASRFQQLTAYAVLEMYNSAGTSILYHSTPEITYS